MNNDATGTATVMQALMSRRSIRAFLPDAVDETALRQIFDHARRAVGQQYPAVAGVRTDWRSTRCALAEDPCRVQRSRG